MINVRQTAKSVDRPNTFPDLLLRKLWNRLGSLFYSSFSALTVVSIAIAAIETHALARNAEGAPN